MRDLLVGLPRGRDRVVAERRIEEPADAMAERGHVHGVAVGSGARGCLGADIDAGAILDAPLLGCVGFGLRDRPLDPYGTVKRVDNAAEFGEETIPHEFEDPAMMPVYLRLEKLLPTRF